MTAKPSLHPVRFSGTALEYFKIWIVNICLTIVTLGIYSAWAKVRTLRYFYGSTSLDGHTFAYLADPIKILKGRIIAVGLLIAYSLAVNFYPTVALWMLVGIVLAIPFVIMAASAFKLRNSAYRNVRFQFRRDFKRAYLAFLLPLGLALAAALLLYRWMDSSGFFDALEQVEGGETARTDMLVALFFLAFLPVLPWLDYIRSKLVVSNAGFGQLRATLFARVGQFYAIYLATFAMLFGIGILVGILSAIVFAAIGVGGNLDPAEVPTGPFVALALVFYALGFFATGYLQARRRNIIFGGTTFGQNAIVSDVRAGDLGWIYLSNTVAIIVSLGLLIPWASIRLARYLAACTQVEINDIASVIAATTPDQAAFGEELGDAFDIDIGI